MDFLFSIIAFIVLVGVLVAIHEYGHFIAAKLCNVKVLRYSIGFGKVLASIPLPNGEKGRNVTPSSLQVCSMPNSG